MHIDTFFWLPGRHAADVCCPQTGRHGELGHLRSHLLSVSTLSGPQALLCCLMHIKTPAHAGEFDAQALRSLQSGRQLWAAGQARSLLRDASYERDGGCLNLLEHTQPLLAQFSDEEAIWKLLRPFPRSPHALLRFTRPRGRAQCRAAHAIQTSTSLAAYGQCIAWNMLRLTWCASLPSLCSRNHLIAWLHVWAVCSGCAWATICLCPAWPLPGVLALPEQVNILCQRCQHDSCKRTAKYGSAEDGVRRFCSRHKHAGMVRPQRAEVTLPQVPEAHMSDVLQR